MLKNICIPFILLTALCAITTAEEKKESSETKTTEKSGVVKAKANTPEPAKKPDAKSEAAAQAKPADKSADKKAAPAKQAATKPAGTASTNTSEAAMNSAKKTDAASELNVKRATLCRSVKDREPVDVAQEFKANEKVFLFTEIVGANTPQTISHKWYQGDVLMDDIELKVNSPQWRTRSQKSLYDKTGNWKVEVVDDESGAILETVTFTTK